jgi:hypothetical protein
MSARKQYHTGWGEGAAYTENELKTQKDYQEKFPRIVGCFFTDLCDKWRPRFHPSGFVTFMLVSYENCGATFGIELWIEGDSRFQLRTYEMSGYTDGYILQASSNLVDINKFIEGFEPARYIFD